MTNTNQYQSGCLSAVNFMKNCQFCFWLWLYQFYSADLKLCQQPWICANTSFLPSRRIFCGFRHSILACKWPIDGPKQGRQIFCCCSAPRALRDNNATTYLSPHTHITHTHTHTDWLVTSLQSNYVRRVFFLLKAWLPTDVLQYEANESLDIEHLKLHIS